MARSENWLASSVETQQNLYYTKTEPRAVARKEMADAKGKLEDHISACPTCETKTEGFSTKHQIHKVVLGVPGCNSNNVAGFPG